MGKRGEGGTNRNLAQLTVTVEHSRNKWNHRRLDRIFLSKLKSQLKYTCQKLKKDL